MSIKAIPAAFTVILIACQGSTAEDRETDARARTEAGLVRDLKALEIPYPPKGVLLRAFKQEKLLEVWVRGEEGAYKRLETLAILAASGEVGPKRREGDLQVPEGVYHVDRFNPKSSYHLSMGINYPNRSDRVRSDQAKPGGDVFIHGSNVSIGCLALGNSVIERLYTLCRGLRTRVHVHLYPCRMEGAPWRRLRSDHPEWRSFWDELEPIYADFQRRRVLSDVSINRFGAYSLR